MEGLFRLFYECAGVSTDTRSVKPNELFIALKGDHFNGNKYAGQAIKNGAKYAIVDEEQYADGKVIFCVNNSLIYLQKLAEYHRSQFSIPVIGITGSNGKTTTKELIAAVLSKKYNTLFTQGNLNNHIGVPLTLLQLHEKHDIAIIEMGASKPGDIKELTDIAHPTYGIITNIGTAHIEGFGNKENILKTKTELYNAVAEIKGHLFCNVDDIVLMNEIPEACSCSTYGTMQKADISGEILCLTPNLNLKWETINYESKPIETQIIGKYNLHNLLAAICIGKYFSVDFSLIDEALQEYAPNNNRSQLTKTDNNYLILDAYNANPTSVKLALENFAEIESEENKLFILGDMLELGGDSLKYHQEIIDLAKDLKLQGVYIGKNYMDLAIRNDIVAFDSVIEARQFFSPVKPKNNLILLKGSRGIGLEKLVDDL